MYLSTSMSIRLSCSNRIFIWCKQTTSIFIQLIFNVNTFLKWVPTSESRVTYDLDTDLDIRYRHHNAQNYRSSGELPLPRYACTYRPSKILSFTDKSSEQFAGVNRLYFPINKFFLKRKITKISPSSPPPPLYFLNTF